MSNRLIAVINYSVLQLVENHKKSDSDWFTFIEITCKFELELLQSHHPDMVSQSENGQRLKFGLELWMNKSCLS